MSKLNNAHSELVIVLTGDVALTAWANAHFGKAFTVLNGNRDLKEFRDNELPALVFELGDGEPTPMGHKYNDVTQQIKFGFVWYEDNFEAAFDQRKGLPEIVLDAIMRTDTLNGAVADAALTAWRFAQGVDNAYMHSAQFDLDITYGQAVNN